MHVLFLISVHFVIIIIIIFLNQLNYVTLIKQTFNSLFTYYSHYW